MKKDLILLKDIMQDKIVYFDENHIDACKYFCNTLHISNLPAIDGKSFYKLNTTGFFEKTIIDEGQKVFLDEKIIDFNLLEKFKKNKNNVLFVYDKKILSGIVYVSDYNKDVVIQSLQYDILYFERRLRQFLSLLGYDNSSILDFISSKNNDDYYASRLKFHLKNKNSMDSLGEFQLFSLSELLDFCNRSKIFKTDGKKKDSIQNIRNTAMHGKNLVKSDASVYDIYSLEKFLLDLDIFDDLQSELDFLIYENEDYQKSLSLDNSKKLEIIYEHKPRAINYFLGTDY